MADWDDVTFTVDGVDIQAEMNAVGYEFCILDIAGRDPLETQVQSQERKGIDGVRLISTFHSERVIEVDYSLNARNPSERREAGLLLGKILGRRGLQDIRFSDQGGKYYQGVVQNQEGSGFLLKQGNGTLAIFCPRPYLYGEEKVAILNGSGTLNLTTGYPTPPRIIWETSSTVGAAWIEIDGKRLTIDTSISGGQQINIDSQRKETRVGGVLTIDVKGEYPLIQDGSVVSSSPGGEIRFDYREVWV